MSGPWLAAVSLPGDVHREATGTTAALAAVLLPAPQSATVLLPVPAAAPSGTARVIGDAVESLAAAPAGGAAS